MRPINKSRPRNKGHRRSNGNSINKVFESSGPEGKVRGNAQQIIDKYEALARDAFLAGDRITGESFKQHCEHYVRILGEVRANIESRAAASNSHPPFANNQAGSSGSQDDTSNQMIAEKREQPGTGPKDVQAEAGN